MPHDPFLLLMDRDGTLMVDVGYPNDPDAVRLLPGAAEAVREMVKLGAVPAVVSNQSGIARGRITRDQAMAVHLRFVDLFEAASGVKLPCFYCPHGPNAGCKCRKPKPKLLKMAAYTLGFAGSPTVIIGDKPADVLAGKAFGAYTIWLSHGNMYTEEPRPDAIANNWPAADAILRQWIASREGSA